MSSKAPYPQHGRFAVAMPTGHIILETIRFRAYDSRTALGEYFIDIKLHGGRITTPQEGWAFALKRGYRVVKVDIIPQEGK